MASIGFVYLLGNQAMPCFYKIGCTERAPHARARELSNASGVPKPFDVLLYIEVEDFQRVETKFHRALSEYRAERNREFFCFGPAHMNWLWYAFDSYEHSLSFTEGAWRKYGSRPQFPDEYEEAWIFECSELLLPDAPPLKMGDVLVTV